MRAGGFDGAVVLRPLGVEVLLYSIERNALLWSGVTETFEPQSLRNVVTDIAAAVVTVLEREGLLIRSEP